MNGCVNTDEASVTFYDCTGIEEHSDSKLIDVYPNPGTGDFSVKSMSLPTGSYDLAVFDAKGNKVYAENGIVVENEFNRNLNLKHLSNGIYILQIINNQNSYSKQIIIKK